MTEPAHGVRLQEGKPKRSEWTEYEKHFWDLCQEKGWKPDVAEDNCPVLLPNRSSDCYHVYPHGPGVFSCTIMAEHGKTKNAIIKKLRRANVLQKDEDLWDGDTEAVVFFTEDRLARAVKTLNLKKKRKSDPAHMAKVNAGLERWKKEQDAKGL